MDRYVWACTYKTYPARRLIALVILRHEDGK